MRSLASAFPRRRETAALQDSPGEGSRGGTGLVRAFIFKPDGIGDFVLATGAIRLLAREFGEENLILCVKSILVPLARSQFPRATVFDLPVAAKRRILNLFLRNLLACLPLWWRVRTTSVETTICLRSMRNYLETLIFLSVRSRRHIANENILLRGKRRVRMTVEQTVNRIFGTELVAYPDPGNLPMELEAHRRVLEQTLRRPVAAEEVLPVITSASPTEMAEAYWVCAPITNLASKLYPPAKWQKLFEELLPEAGLKKILLVGSEDQRASLEELEGLLRASGCAGVEVFFPVDLVAFVDCIAGAEMLFTVDTAAAHFSTALDRRTLILFSGLHRGMFGPWSRSAAQSWLEPLAFPNGKKKKWHAGIEPSRAAAEARRLLALSARELPPIPPNR